MKKTSDALSNEIAALKSRHRIRTMRRAMNVFQGLTAEETRKGSLHSDMDIAIKLINKLISERNILRAGKAVEATNNEVTF